MAFRSFTGPPVLFQRGWEHDGFQQVLVHQSPRRLWRRPLTVATKHIHATTHQKCRWELRKREPKIEKKTEYECGRTAGLNRKGFRGGWVGDGLGDGWCGC